MTAPRFIRRSAEPAELAEPRSFARDGQLERADGGATYTACIAVWEQPDSHGDAFLRGSIDLAIPPAGIPLLVSHRRGDDPVGRVVELSNRDDGCYATIEFATTERAREVQSLVEGGFYRGVSFGGLGTEGYERADGVWIYTRATVQELSITAFPADAGAVFEIARSAVAALAEPEAEVEPEATEEPVSPAEVEVVDDASLEGDEDDAAELDDAATVPFGEELGLLGLL